MPPACAYTAKQILLKPNLGYPDAPPVTVGIPVIAEVIAGIRRVNQRAEILIVEGVCYRLPAAVIAQKLGVTKLLTAGVQFLDADTLPCCIYENTAKEPQHFTAIFK